jgi:hypothetical protein
MPIAYEPWAIDNDKVNLWGVKIKEGKFDGAIVSINEFKLADDESGEATLDFNFIQKPENLTTEELDSQDFTNVMSEIINDVIRKAILDYENELGSNNSSESA